MSRLTRPLFVVAILAQIFTATRTEAQSQWVQVIFNVPLTLRNLHPEIAEVVAECTISGGYIPAPAQVLWNPVSLWTQPTPGTRQGTVQSTVTTTIPADSGGKTATYSCVIKGRTTGRIVGILSNTATDLRFKVATNPATVTGTFVW